MSPPRSSFILPRFLSPPFRPGPPPCFLQGLGADLRVPGVLAPVAESLSPLPAPGADGVGRGQERRPLAGAWSRREREQGRASSDVRPHGSPRRRLLPGLPPSPFSPGGPGAPSRPSRPSRPGRPWLPWWPGVPGRPGCPGHRLGILLSSSGGEPAARPRSSRARSGLMALARGARTPGASGRPFSWL